ncbi:hypothetical protein [Campylobacter sp. JMF_03 NE3]|uniref:hypothetical protein n=1 Tax=Campylobacter sp. JMF_03 NE3 TaxID=2983831 RepID=UPI0022E9D8DF|nr:hypothetical protein [Campylobacter sp. JMF_03 NE3]MDA3053659.1 hypothetical protein [Campylobacter sp. JMF_03 NE3]
MVNYLAGSFGSLGKSEIDILVFSLLEPYLAMSNYEKSRQLKITDTRVKALCLNAHLRYGKKDDDEIIKEILSSLNSENSKSKIDFEKGEIVFGLENSVQRDVFIGRIKKLGYYADFSFNSEIVMVSIDAIFGLIGDEKFKNIVQKHKNYDEIKKKLNGEKTTWQKLKEFIPDKKSLTGIVLNLLGSILLPKIIT